MVGQLVVVRDEIHFFLIAGCDSYLENNAQLRAVIEELSKSSVSMKGVLQNVGQLLC